MAPYQWSSCRFRAMNTDISLWLYSDAQNDAEILGDVQQMFHALEECLSRFNPVSELCRLNDSPGPFKASHTLLAVVEVALWAAEATGGLFDPTLLPALVQAGYAVSFEKVEKAISIASPPSILEPPCPGRFRTITLNRARAIIDKPPHLKLDLGGIGKGWAVDRATDRLVGLGPFLVNAGGDLYAYGIPPNESGWLVQIPHPLAESRLVASLRISNRAVATSSIARRRWQRGGQACHHLIDPRTAQPAETDLLAVTVIGDRVATAEVYAKTALIIGSQHALDYLESIPDVEGLIITHQNEMQQTSGFKLYLEETLPKEQSNSL